MRLVILDTYPTLFAGSQRIAGQIAGGLAARGWETKVVFPADGPAVAALRERGVDVVVVPTPQVLLHYGGRRSLWGFVRSVVALPVWWARMFPLLRRADVVWLHDLRGFLLCALPARCLRRPTVWHMHGRQPQLNWAIPRLRRFAQAAVVPSARDTLGFAAEDVTVIANPVAVEGAPWQDPELAIPVVATIGRLHREKGFDVLLAASALLHERGLAHRVQIIGPVLAGHADVADALAATAARLGIADHVEFTGPVDRPMDLVRRATVYVQPSRSEPFGLAALEASALGAPVVATAVGGLADIVADGVSGLLVPPDDPSALADALQRLLTDAGMRSRLGASARERVVAQFSEDRFVDQVEQVCRSVSRAAA